MRAILDACHAWHGPMGAAATDGKHAITGKAGKEGGKKQLTRGPHESVGKKGEKGVASSGQAVAA